MGGQAVDDDRGDAAAGEVEVEAVQIGGGAGDDGGDGVERLVVGAVVEGDVVVGDVEAGVAEGGEEPVADAEGGWGGGAAAPRSSAATAVATAARRRADHRR
ncbi:hypothetical protein GCM10020000_20940 [Streptomyces olivoverticillatus]